MRIVWLPPHCAMPVRDGGEGRLKYLSFECGYVELRKMVFTRLKVPGSGVGGKLF